MIDITPLTSPITSPAERELLELDPLLEQIIGHADHSRFLPAAELAERLWKERIYDVRIIGFYLFGAFLESGIQALPQILSSVETTLTVNWSWLGPKDNRQRLGDGALRGLFTNILGQLRFYQRGQGADWQARLQQWEKVPQQQLLTQAAEIAELSTRVFQAAQTQGQLLALRSFLRTLPAAAKAPEPAENRSAAKPSPAQDASAAASSPEPDAPDASDAPDEADVHVAESAAARPRAVSAPEDSALLALPIAPPLDLLLRRLDAFNHLVGLGKFRQAVIVYKDIEASLQSFDPRHYLPTLFSEYIKNVFVHADKLERGLSSKDDFAGNALGLLYRVDLELFIKAKG